VPVATAWERLLAILRTAPVNQVAMYAEAALRAAPGNDPAALAAIVRMRRDGIALPAKRARLEKVLRRLAKIEGDKGDSYFNARRHFKRAGRG
jgi:hypothetical protein